MVFLNGDNKMSEQNPSQSEIADELRRLGENINQFAKAAWESPERQKIQQDLETGLNEIGTNLEKAAQQFSQSPTGQQIKNDIDDFGQRLSNGEVESKVKKEFISFLGELNQQIEQAANRHQPGSGSESPKKD
jgi:hypothetical protein